MERKIRQMGENETGVGTMERSMPIRLRPAGEEDLAALRFPLKYLILMGE